jgi:tripartite-type tricarboxylate transporter receptor subunit TctC
MVKKPMTMLWVLIFIGVLGLASCTPEAEPMKPVDFYKDKTIDLVVSESPGALSDLIARIMASYLAGDTDARVVVTNRRGAGGMEGMNYLYESKPDGLTLGVTSSVKAVSNKIMKEPAAIYELEEFSYIMSIGYRPNYFFVSAEGPYHSVADLQAAEDLKLGAGSPSGYISLANLTIIKVLGLDGKVITGFKGGAERALAVQRGEVIGYAITMAGAKPYIEAGMIKPLFALATERDPLTPKTPAITELVQLSGEDIALVKLWETTLVGSSLIAASPATPEDRLAFFRGLANNWIQDEGFRKGISAISGYEVQDHEYTTGEGVTKSMLDMATSLDKFQAIFAELIEKYRI